MDILSWVLLGLIAVWVVAAILHLVRHGSCSCGSTGCTSCGGVCRNCSSCRKKQN